MPEQHVKINGKTFLYKQKAPFVASGMSVLGAIEYDAEADKVRCHECGEWFKRVDTHAFKAHGILARDYKIKHGLRQKTAMTNEKFRIDNSRRMTEMVAAEDPVRYRVRMAKVRSMAQRKRGGTKPVWMEKRNERGGCAAQLLERIKQLASKVGHTPSTVEMRKAGIHPFSACLVLNVKNIGAVTSLADLFPNKLCPGKGHRYSNTVLTEMLRDFYVSHERLPRRTDHRRGLLPNDKTFCRRFGSMKNAYRAAGLGLVAAAEAGK